MSMFDTDTSLVLDDEAVEMLDELRTIRDTIRALKGREEDIRASLLEALKDADQGVDEFGVPLVEIRRQPRSRVDTKKLQALYQDVWEKCQTETIVASIRFPSDD